jgi:REP element-mobilizing transposase RayT
MQTHFLVEKHCQGELIQTVPRIMSRPRKHQLQLTLDSARKPIGRGGWRPNAGRPRGRKVVPHDARPTHKARHPVHVTLRLHADAPRIAREWLMKTIHAGIRDSHKPGFRIVEFNVLSNHIHMLVEAEGTGELSRGMQGFAGRLALRLNRTLRRSGKLFATRFHARTLTTPRDVRNTLRYVLLNRKHHDTYTRFDRYWIDPHSSAAWFDGWAEPIRGAYWKHELAAMPPPTRRASTWLLATGWRKRGLLRFDEAPA